MVGLWILDDFVQTSSIINQHNTRISHDHLRLKQIKLLWRNITIKGFIIINQYYNKSIKIYHSNLSKSSCSMTCSIILLFSWLGPVLLVLIQKFNLLELLFYLQNLQFSWFPKFVNAMCPKRILKFHGKRHLRILQISITKIPQIPTIRKGPKKVFWIRLWWHVFRLVDRVCDVMMDRREQDSHSNMNLPNIGEVSLASNPLPVLARK